MPDPRWPFLGSEVLARHELSERAMRNKYEPIYPGVFGPKKVKPTAQQRAEAAWLWSRRRGVVAGSSAAVLLGTKWVKGSEPAELIHGNRRAPDDLIVRTEIVAAAELLEVGGIRVTSPARTGFDIGRHMRGRLPVVQRLDALANATDLEVADVEAVMVAHPSARGLPRLRRVLPLVDGGAESPQETLARLILVDAGLPAPRTQFSVYGRFGEFIGRVDMVYEDVKVGIEYDGPQHWEDPAIRQRDIDKGFEFNALGWFIVRASRDLLKYRRSTYVRRVETALRERGFVW